MAAEKGRTVCVTGAGGFVGSWLVKHLLSKNYNVHGTVRDPLDEKNAHLKSLEKASENLKLFKADLLDYKSLCAAITGCYGVFHTASPVPPSSVPNPEVELIQPAVNGTLNVLKACCEVNAKKVVFVSSVAAIAAMPNRPKDRPMDETFWSDKEFCRSANEWYCLSKTLAESEAWEFSKNNGIDFKSICPTLIFGPVLQGTVNASSLALLKLLKGYEELENRDLMIVDVRDLVEALLLLYENPEADGRYICTSHFTSNKELVEKLKKYYPDFNYPKKLIEPKDASFLVTSEKLQRLGWSYRPLEETLIDAVESYKQLALVGAAV